MKIFYFHRIFVLDHNYQGGIKIPCHEPYCVLSLGAISIPIKNNRECCGAFPPENTEYHIDCLYSTYSRPERHQKIENMSRMAIGLVSLCLGGLVKRKRHIQQLHMSKTSSRISKLPKEGSQTNHYYSLLAEKLKFWTPN